MGAFERAFAKVVLIEGDYGNHKDDLGGATRYGVTEAVARQHGYIGAMPLLPLSVAHDIYRKRFWNVLSLDPIAELSEPIADELFDTGVNMGTGMAGAFLQRALNSLNRQQADYADLIVDGVIGGKSVATLRSYLKLRGKRGEIVMLRALNSLQGARYIEISEARQANETFTFGWFDNRVAI